MKIIETIVDKKKFLFTPSRDGWIPHQYEETKQYDSFFGWDKDWIVVDIGAWLGLWTIWASPNVRKVYALEPLPDLYSDLMRNLSLNDALNVKARKKALWRHTGLMDMTITKYPAASTLVDGAWNYGAEWLYKGSSRIKVACNTWDDWTKKEKLDTVNLLKMDVEGSELSILEGMTQVLPERISIAIYHKPSPFRNIFLELEGKGYELDGFGYYDSRAPNRGKKHSGFFRRTDIPFQSPVHYSMREYELPTREEMSQGIPFYWESMGVQESSITSHISFRGKC